MQHDLVKLGETMYKAFAGVDPVRRTSSSSVDVVGEATSADGSPGGGGGGGCGGGPSKRRSMGSLDSGKDSLTDGKYVPLRDMGYPTSLCICVGSLLDASNTRRPDRYNSIDEVEADLVLMTGKPDRYLFDPRPTASSTPASTPSVPMSAASIVNGAIDSSRLSFPTNKLYGRDQQLAELLHIFQHVLVEGGQREFVTLTGYAGTGKTALVEQLRKPLASMSGNLICCKFDKLNNTQPMQVIFNAFDAYCKEIAGIGGCSRKTPEIPNMPCYCHVREAVQKTLGGNISVLTDLMPNMRHLAVDDEVMSSGSTDLPGVEALNRFIYFFRMFVRAIASTKTPLVLFLDDLQWSDAAALELISTLASDSEVKSMLFVATYREEDVSQDHPLHSELARLRVSGIRINSLSLDNIGGKDLNAYVSDVLNLSPRITRPLAEVVHAKTTGNILFVVEFLRSLSAEGLLRFSARSRRWEWDAEAIQARSVDDNVVGLIMKKMLNLDKDMQWMLKVAACLGSQSNGETLIQLLLSGQRSMAMVTATLDVAVKKGLMAKVGSDYKFPHDQIEQAAYSLIPVEQRPALHLSIGRTLWGHQTADQLGDRLELVVNQLSRGADLISDQNEQVRFAELCLVAGRKAKAGSAFLLASTYLLQGIVLLNEDSWTHHYKLCLELHSSCAEAQFATGNHAGISISVNPIMSHGQNLQDKMRAYYTLLRSLGAKGQQSDAVTCGLGLLSALGESLPANPQKQDADNEFQKTENMLRNFNVVDISSGKILVNTQKASAIKALFLLIRHAHMVNQMLMSIMICRMVQLSILFGVSKESAFAFAAYGTLCSKYVGIDDACLYGKVALSIVERFNAKDVLARVTCVLNDFLIFKEPLQSRLPSLKNAYEIGLQMGDIEWALTDANIYILTAIQSGRNLSVLSSEIQSFMQQMKVYKHHTLIVATLYNRFVTNLIEDTGDPTDLALNSDEFVGMTQEVKRISIVNRGYFLRLWLAYLFGNYQLAADMAERRWEMNKSRPFRSSSLANETFYTGLAAVMMVRKGGAVEMKWKGVALAGRDELKKWMSHSDWNFAHKYLLLSAEIEFYLNKNAEEASKLYDRAIESAKKHSFQSELALAYERTAMLYESNLNQAKALEYYRLAHQAYVDWGGDTKARQLYEKTVV